jgi:uncharacterized protein YecE (DUF72 family)
MIYFGTAGFQYPDWKGTVYPHDVKRRYGHELSFLALFFDCCEINTSFYGHIRPEIGKLWAQKVQAANPDFVFTAKLHRSFTHSPMAMAGPTSAATINPNPQDERMVRDGLEALASTGKLAALLIQFPVSFKNTPLNREYIEGLVHKFGQFPCAIEVRHGSWNEPGTLKYFAEKNIAFCNIDQPQIGRSLAPTEHVTSGIGYIRLHGRNYKEWFDTEESNDRYNYLYKRHELEEWAGRIKTVADHTDKTFVIGNNHPDGKAAINLLELKSLLYGKKVKGPETLVETYPNSRDFIEQVAVEGPQETGKLFG